MKSWRAALLASSLALAVPVRAQGLAPIVGTVVDAGGVPAAGVELVARWRARPELPGSVGWTLDPGTAPFGIVESSTRSDARGRFRIESPGPVPVLLTARAGEHAATQVFPVLPGEVARLRLEPLFWFRGLVRGRDGAPAAGATVRLALAYGSIWRRADDYAYPPQLRSTTSDAAGRFALQYEPGYLRLPAWACLPGIYALGEGGEASGRPDQIRPIRADAERVLSLMPPGQVRITVTGAGGEALATARALDLGLPELELASDAHGVIAAPMLGGVYWLHAPGHAAQQFIGPAQIEGNVVSVALAPQAELEIAKLPRRFAGARVLISCRNEDSQFGLPLEFQVTVAEDGGVRCATLPRGEAIAAWVESAGRFLPIARGIVRENGAEFVACDPAPLVVAGQVVDPDAVPAVHARVVLRVEGWPSDVTWTDRAGRFRFESAAPGPFRVDAVLDGRGYGQHDGQTAMGTRENLAIALVRGRRLEGIVLGVDGQPVGNAWVSALESIGAVRAPMAGISGDFAAQVVFTDAEGRFRFESLAAETVTLFANQLVDGLRYQATVSVPTNAEAGAEPVRLTLVEQAR